MCSTLLTDHESEGFSSPWYAQDSFVVPELGWDGGARWEQDVWPMEWVASPSNSYRSPGNGSSNTLTSSLCQSSFENVDPLEYYTQAPTIFDPRDTVMGSGYQCEHTSVESSSTWSGVYPCTVISPYLWQDTESFIVQEPLPWVVSCVSKPEKALQLPAISDNSMQTWRSLEVAETSSADQPSPFSHFPILAHKVSFDLQNSNQLPLRTRATAPRQDSYARIEPDPRTTVVWPVSKSSQNWSYHSSTTVPSSSHQNLGFAETTRKRKCNESTALKNAKRSKAPAGVPASYYGTFGEEVKPKKTEPRKRCKQACLRCFLIKKVCNGTFPCQRCQYAKGNYRESTQVGSLQPRCITSNMNELNVLERVFSNDLWVSLNDLGGLPDLRRAGMTSTSRAAQIVQRRVILNPNRYSCTVRPTHTNIQEYDNLFLDTAMLIHMVFEPEIWSIAGISRNQGYRISAMYSNSWFQYINLAIRRMRTTRMAIMTQLDLLCCLNILVLLIRMFFGHGSDSLYHYSFDKIPDGMVQHLLSYLCCVIENIEKRIKGLENEDVMHFRTKQLILEQLCHKKFLEELNIGEEFDASKLRDGYEAIEDFGGVDPPQCSMEGLTGAESIGFQDGDADCE